VQRVLILTPVPTNIPNGTVTSSEIDEFLLSTHRTRTKWNKSNRSV